MSDQEIIVCSDIRDGVVVSITFICNGDIPVDLPNFHLSSFGEREMIQLLLDEIKRREHVFGVSLVGFNIRKQLRDLRRRAVVLGCQYSDVIDCYHCGVEIIDYSADSIEALYKERFGGSVPSFLFEPNSNAIHARMIRAIHRSEKQKNKEMVDARERQNSAG